MKQQTWKGHLDLLTLAVLADGPKHGYAVIEALRTPERRGVRSAGGHGLSGAAPAGEGGPARLRVVGRAGSAAPHLPTHGEGSECAGGAAGQLGALRSGGQHGVGRCGMAGYDLIDHYLGVFGAASAGAPTPTRSSMNFVIICTRPWTTLRRTPPMTSAEQRRLLARFGASRTRSPPPWPRRRGVGSPCRPNRPGRRHARRRHRRTVAGVPVGVADRGRRGRPGGVRLAVQVIFMAGTLGLIAAGGLTVAVMIGLRERLGGLGVLATVGMVFTGLGAAAASSRGSSPGGRHPWPSAGRCSPSR